jgi:hypothetical protein
MNESFTTRAESGRPGGPLGHPPCGLHRQRTPTERPKVAFGARHAPKVALGRSGQRATRPASWASNPACVRFAQSSFTSIRDT